MANIYSTPSTRANLSYNGFDLSHLLKFSSSVGELLPVYKDILYPGDKVSIKTILKSRTNELESSAMVSLTEHLEWYFVPMRLLYEPFTSFITGVDDINSSLIISGSPLPDTMPFITAANMPDALTGLGTDPDLYFPNTSQSDQNLYVLGRGVYVAELLGIPYNESFSNRGQGSEPNWTFNKAVSPIFGCAYQKIFYDHYRISDREQNEPGDYNLDYYVTGASIPAAKMKDFFRVRYRPWKKDFFTHNFVSPLFGSSGINSYPGSNFNLENSFNQWLLSSYSATSGSSFPLGINTLISSGSLDTVNPSAISSVGATSSAWSSTSSPSNGNMARFVGAAASPTSIRTSFAVQKLLEVTRRAGKHYDKQILAHFGVNVPEAASYESQFVGATSEELRIFDVVSTAGVPNGDPLGKVGGKGYSGTDPDKARSIKFEAREHGILMCIFSVEPLADYQNNMYDKLNGLINKSDFYQPEFDNLGMQPLFAYQAYMNETPSPGTVNEQILGWQYRYMELKTRFNRICGSLQRSQSFWTAYRYAAAGGLSDYYISPFYLDSVMLVKYGSNNAVLNDVNNLNSRDPLIHELYFESYKSSKMSAYGLEQL